jgi:hypothetical protein
LAKKSLDNKTGPGFVVWKRAEAKTSTTKAAKAIWITTSKNADAELNLLIKLCG